jgi:heterodisulfide reductase subunit B
MFLDRWQYTLAEMEGNIRPDGKGIPVLTYEELAGLVLGYNPWDLGLQMHQIDCEPLLDKMQIPYNTDEKYLGINNKFIGRPEMAACLI